jgi:hypothetical protein
MWHAAVVANSSAIAFDANPDGNWDVFVIPSAGGGRNASRHTDAGSRAQLVT